MARQLFPAVALVIVAQLVVGAARAQAARASEQLLPATTKGYLSVPSMEQLREKWNETQLGQMMRDPAMEPFLEELKGQLRSRLDRPEGRLGITWAELEEAASGEVCLAVLQPWDPEEAQREIEAAVQRAVSAAEQRGRSPRQISEIRSRAEQNAREAQQAERLAQKALVLLVDVTGRKAEADELLEKVSAKLIDRGARRDSLTRGGVSMARFTFPQEDQQTDPRRAYYFIYQDQLVAVDNLEVAENIVDRFEGEHEGTLADLAAFDRAMSHAGQALGDLTPQIRWFAEPFGYVQVGRAYRGGRQGRGTDLLKVLANQGFTAIRGLGGQIALATEQYEILHRTFIYAPPVEREEGDAETGKYNLAANMLDFPNRPHETLEPQDWVPEGVASYTTFNWDMKQAFEASKTLVNELAGDKVFEDVLQSIATDPSGPQIDIREELIAHLGQRTSMLVDHRDPITVDSQRLLFVLEVDNAAAVTRTVNKAMENDPAAEKRVHNGRVIWELLPEGVGEVETVEIETPAFGFEAEEAAPEDQEGLVPTSAVTVAHKHLLIASHVDFIVEILDETAGDQQLAAVSDYQRVQDALADLGAGDDSFHFFSRTDQATHTTYELIRQGKMPEAKSMLGRVLNRMFGPEEEGESREQYIHGEKMPPFEEIRKYLGVSGSFVRTEADGWAAAGCLLEKAE